MAKTPKTKRLELSVDPYQGCARMATAIDPPKGYEFVRVTRKGRKVVIHYRRVAPPIADG
jgi:hypothetical protein